MELTRTDDTHLRVRNLGGTNTAAAPVFFRFVDSEAPAANTQRARPPQFSAQRLTLSKTPGDGIIEYRLGNLERLNPGEIPAVYFFLSRTNGPPLTQSLFTAPPGDHRYKRSLLTQGGEVTAFEEELIKVGSKERVGYRYLRFTPSRWNQSDNGKSVSISFNSFTLADGKPDWEWFGPETRVSAVLLALHEKDYITHPIMSRFLEDPTQATFQTKLLMADGLSQNVWRPSSRKGADAPNAGPAPSDPEVLKRLMERRKRELEER